MKAVDVFPRAFAPSMPGTSFSSRLLSQKLRIGCRWGCSWVLLESVWGRWCFTSVCQLLFFLPLSPPHISSLSQKLGLSSIQSFDVGDENSFGSTTKLWQGHSISSDAGSHVAEILECWINQISFLKKFLFVGKIASRKIMWWKRPTQWSHSNSGSFWLNHHYILVQPAYRAVGERLGIESSRSFFHREDSWSVFTWLYSFRASK